MSISKLFPSNECLNLAQAIIDARRIIIGGCSLLSIKHRCFSFTTYILKNPSFVSIMNWQQYTGDNIYFILCARCNSASEIINNDCFKYTHLADSFFSFKTISSILLLFIKTVLAFCYLSLSLSISLFYDIYIHI